MGIWCVLISRPLSQQTSGLNKLVIKENPPWSLSQLSRKSLPEPATQSQLSLNNLRVFSCKVKLTSIIFNHVFEEICIKFVFIARVSTLLSECAPTLWRLSRRCFDRYLSIFFPWQMSLPFSKREPFNVRTMSFFLFPACPSLTSILFVFTCCYLRRVSCKDLWHCLVSLLFSLFLSLSHPPSDVSI